MKLRSNGINEIFGTVGMGISTRGVLHYLYETGCQRVCVRAPTPWSEDILLPPFRHVIKRIGSEYLSDITEGTLFLSPSVRRDIPALADAVRRGVCLSSDSEVFFAGTPKNAFCITGSDGKSTTAALSARLLRTVAQRRVRLGGNIGVALSPFLCDARADDVYAVELSSFQLAYMHPHSRRALITGLSENHLNWHTDMREYVDAKSHIYTNADECVLHADDPLCVQALGKRRPFAAYSASLTPRDMARIQADVAVYAEDGYICEGGKRLLPLTSIRLIGRHNVQNVMAAIALTWGYHDTAALEDAVYGFEGLPHRAETVATVRGITYVDASIDSSPTRTLTTLAAMPKPPILILCGRSKHLDTGPLRLALPHQTKAVVCTGEFGRHMYEALTDAAYAKEHAVNAVYAETLEDAVARATELATVGDTVLLSPAATSFDAYRSFEERGRAFAAAVMAL